MICITCYICTGTCQSCAFYVLGVTSFEEAARLLRGESILGLFAHKEAEQWYLTVSPQLFWLCNILETILCIQINCKCLNKMIHVWTSEWCKKVFQLTALYLIRVEGLSVNLPALLVSRGPGVPYEVYSLPSSSPTDLVSLIKQVELDRFVSCFEKTVANLPHVSQLLNGTLYWNHMCFTGI